MSFMQIAHRRRLLSASKSTNRIVAKYAGEYSGLSVARSRHASTSFNNNVIFAGGTPSSTTFTNSVDAYDNALVRTTITALQQARSNFYGTALPSYAFFGGGTIASDASINTSYSNRVDSYNAALTRSSLSNLGTARRHAEAAATQGYALFAGGNNTNVLAVVDAYNDEGSKTTSPTSLSTARQGQRGASFAGYALFAGGQTTAAGVSGVIATIDAYEGLTKITNPQGLSVARTGPASAIAGNYCLFTGGTTGSPSKVVDVYDTSLTRLTPLSLSIARQNHSGTSLSDFAIFAGGIDNNTTDVFDKTLVRSSPENLSSNRWLFASASVGRYAVFSGGVVNSSGACSSTADVYTIQYE